MTSEKLAVAANVETYNVFRVETRLGVQDPLMGSAIRNHNSVFIETSDDGSGRVLQVNGNLVDSGGMYFEDIQSLSPQAEDTFIRKHRLGQINAIDYGKVVELLKSIDPPPRQRIWSYTERAWVQCRPDGALYGENEEKPRYWKCTEWTLEKAIPALIESGLLRPT